MTPSALYRPYRPEVEAKVPKNKGIEMLEIGLSDIATLPKSSSVRALNRRRSFRAKANGIARKVGRKLKSDSPSEDEARSNPATNQ